MNAKRTPKNSPSAFEAQFKMAISLHQAGQLQQARAIYEGMLKVSPRQADALYLLGVIAYQQKQFDAAVSSYTKAIAIKPDYAEAYCYRGDALQDLNRLREAVADYSKAIRLRPDYAEAYINRGVANHQLKEFDAAVLDYNKAISLRPDFAEAYHNRGNALQELEKFDQAVSDYTKAIALRPNYIGAYTNRGNAWHRLQQFRAAVSDHAKAVALKPDYVEAYNNRGAAFEALREFDSAVADYDKAIALKPGYAEAYYNRGKALEGVKKFDLAIADYTKAISLRPGYVGAHYNRGVILQGLNRLDLAVSDYDKVIAIEPAHTEAYWNKALSLLLRGDFEEGFELYEWRWKLAEHEKKRNFSQPLWLGEQALEGTTMLLHSEQGFGDTIQFCRYAKVLAQTGARVVLEVQQPLVRLLAGLDGVSQIVARGAALPAFDHHCPLLSLPLALKTTPGTIPSFVPYLKAEPEKLGFWSSKLGEKKRPRVGLAWNGRPSHMQDHNRIPLAELASCLPEGGEYIAVQKDLRKRDAAHLKQSPVRFFGDQLADFSDTAALCELADLVISVDTSVAHLSGALGKRTWILLQYSPDWRWSLDRDDSPWYPSVKLYRQGSDMAWGNVLQRMQNDLVEPSSIVRLSDS